MVRSSDRPNHALPAGAVLHRHVAGDRLGKRARLTVSDAAWYRKQQPTFANTLAAVRREIWAAQGFSMFRSRTDNRKLTKAMCDGVIHALCNAA